MKETFRPMSVTSDSGKAMARWVFLEDEFEDGDEPALRFDLYRRENGSWGPIDDGSFCTLMPVSANRGVLRRALLFILDSTEDAILKSTSIRKICQALSRIGPDFERNVQFKRLVAQARGECPASGEMRVAEASVRIRAEEAGRVDKILSLKRPWRGAGADETISSYTAWLGRGLEADIFVCNDESGPYAAGALFLNGNAVAWTGRRKRICGRYAFRFRGKEYAATVKRR